MTRQLAGNRRSLPIALTQRLPVQCRCSTSSADERYNPRECRLLRREPTMAKNVNVCLTFDFDAMSVWIGTFHARSPSAISRGEFGDVGAQRVLAMLREWQVPSTWFVPGHTADAFPATLEAIAAAGHEIAHHGYFHDRPAASEDEARDFTRAIDTLK